VSTFAWLPDLASRRLGGSVVYATDEFFGAKENLIKPEPPAFTPDTFGPKGQVYDGWETRRHAPDHDYAIVRLGMPGIVRGIVVDTAYFTGNYPPEVSVEGLDVGDPSGPTESAAAISAGSSVVSVLDGISAWALRQRSDWFALVPPSSMSGDARAEFEVAGKQRVTHVRLSIYPDGGVARLRVHGEVVRSPLAFALGIGDLAALENGGLVVDASDGFYGSPQNLLAPGPARTMGEGWEARRRRDRGHDWVVVRLATRGAIRLVELDTTNFVGNAPESAALHGADLSTDNEDTERNPAGDAAWWIPLLASTALQPDTRHRFLMPDASPATHVRLDIFPDGGASRLRLWGAPTP
jgi:allantoicase